MSFLTNCSSCNKFKFYVRKRKYKTKYTGKITSNGELCGKCYKEIKKLTQTI